MALRDWTPRQIGRLWIFAGMAELLIALALVVPAVTRSRGYGDPRPAVPVPPPDPAADSQRQAFYQHLRDSLGIQVTQLGDSVTRLVKDSFAATLVTHGDTTRVTLSPAAQRKVEPLVTGLREGLKAIGRLILLMLAAVFLPIPMAVGLVTLVWAYQRRKPVAPSRVP